MPITSLGWIILLTDQYAQMKQFYRDKLGLRIARDIPEQEFVQFSMNNCFLALYGKRFASSLISGVTFGTAPGAIYSFSDSDDIDNDYQQLCKSGVQFIQEPKTQTWGQRTAYFTDPDGNIWELQQWVHKDSDK